MVVDLFCQPIKEVALPAIHKFRQIWNDNSDRRMRNSLLNVIADRQDEIMSFDSNNLNGGITRKINRKNVLLNFRF